MLGTNDTVTDMGQNAVIGLHHRSDASKKWRARAVNTLVSPIMEIRKTLGSVGLEERKVGGDGYQLDVHAPRSGGSSYIALSYVSAEKGGKRRMQHIHTMIRRISDWLGQSGIKHEVRQDEAGWWIYVEGPVVEPDPDWIASQPKSGRDFFGESDGSNSGGGHVTKYTALPIVVEALQLNWGTWDAMCDFVGVPENGHGVWTNLEGEYSETREAGHNLMGLLITVGEVPILAREGDMVIKYPVKDVFAVTGIPEFNQMYSQNTNVAPTSHASVLYKYPAYPVYAYKDGKVVVVDSNVPPNGALGIFCKILYANGGEEVYANLSMLIVAEGDSVLEGQLVGVGVHETALRPAIPRVVNVVALGAGKIESIKHGKSGYDMIISYDSGDQETEAEMRTLNVGEGQHVTKGQTLGSRFRFGALKDTEREIAVKQPEILGEADGQ